MRLFLVCIGLAALILIPALVLDDDVEEFLGSEAAVDYLRGYGPWAWLAGVGLIVSDLILPVPCTAVITGLGILYGPWLGGLVGGLGSTLAGAIAYGGCRLMGRRFLHFIVGEANLERLARFFARHGLWAIALSRWLPLLPEALCCLAGMSRMRPGPFLAALACGSLAMGFAFAFLGTAYQDRPALGLLVSALVPVAVWPVVYRFMRRPSSSEENAVG